MLGRQLLIARIVNEHWSVAAAARAQGIWRARAYVLRARYLAEGKTAFELRSSRPRRIARRTSALIERRIEHERRRRRWGPLRLSWLVGMARSTIYAVLRRIGLRRRRDLDPRPAPSRRYERAVPGDLVHLDTKKLGRLPLGGGKRVWEIKRTGHGGVGWEYLHLAVDDRTRVLYAERLPSEDAADCAGFLARAVAYFADRGVRVRQVMTDGHMSYRLGAPFRAVREAWGIEHILTPPYTPRWNGKVERFIQTLKKEWAYAHSWPSSAERTRALASYVRYYNRHRPHSSLRDRPPISRVHNLRGQDS